MKLAAIVILLAIATAVNLALTAAVQWGIEECFQKHVPFWPLFALLMILGALFGGSRK